MISRLFFYEWGASGLQKKILIIEDLSVVGKTSLATAIPIVSAFGHQSIAVPTALLSANTAFKGFTYLDLTEEMVKILKHLEKLKLGIDALYTGYLGSIKQIDIILDYLNKYKKLKYYLDPAMADSGTLYPGFTNEFVAEMKCLVSKAYVLMPNLTEAELLLGLEHKLEYSAFEISEILKGLALLGPENVIITGVKVNNKIINYAYAKNEDKIYSHSYDILPNNYYGTGDIFASIITGAMEKGLSLDFALKLAGDFLFKSIDFTNKLNIDPIYGVCFEEYLSLLGGNLNE